MKYYKNKIDLSFYFKKMNVLFEQLVKWTVEKVELAKTTMGQQEPEKWVGAETIYLILIFMAFFTVTASTIMVLMTILNDGPTEEKMPLSKVIMEKVIDKRRRDAKEICKFAKYHYDFSNVKNPEKSVSSECGRLYTRKLVKRSKKGNKFVYYR